MKEREYDVAIVGASFAGLAVAGRIPSGNVLLMSPEKVGKNCKSACGTMLFVVKDLGLEQAVLQVHKKIVLHAARGTLEYVLEKPFCIVDPQKIAQGLRNMGTAEKAEAQVLRFDGTVLTTNKGDVRARFFVDASGPQSVLSGNRRSFVSFGIETILPYQEEGLHFWYEPDIFPKGIFWLFPQGKTSRFGVGSYEGKTNVRPYLDAFLARFGLKADTLHGGWFPHRLRAPVEGNVFRVGDAAGQCLPLTGEGIRPAIVFGQACGDIIEEILLGKMTPEQGLSRYRDLVLKRRRAYEALYWAQKVLTGIPENLFYPMAWVVSKKPITSFVLKNYVGIL